MADGVSRVVTGRFALGEVIGRGAFGEVYRGRDRLTGEPVAIKRLSTEIADPTTVARFDLEARLLARVRDPHVVGYVDHGVDESGRPCLVLEWLAGEDLERRRHRQPLALDEAIELARQVAVGLSALHAAGIVHRDLKPSNVFLARTQPGDAATLSAASASPLAGTTVKLIDLGIARAAPEPTLTVGNVRPGTPAYMSPEQARGDEAIGPASDLFSLGVLLFELVSGRRPFRANDLYALLTQIVLQPPPTLDRLVPGVPRALSALVARALAKEPRARFASATEMAAALAAVARASPMALPIAPRPLSEPPPPSPRGGVASGPGEQRVVTALFAAHPDEGGLPALARNFLAQAVVAHGGELHALLGGRAVGVFGLRRSTGDEAVRAARAALAVLAHSPDARLSLATCLVGHDAAGLLGEAIEQGAGAADGAAGGVALDDVTARLLAPHFVVEDDPATGARALRRERPALDEEPPRLFGRATVTVGRERELADLEALFDECRDEPVARVAVITAPAGGGKSRLRYELVARLRGRAGPLQVWSARGDPLGAGSPLGLIGQVLREGLGLRTGAVSDDPTRAQLLARVAQVVTDARAARRVAQFLGEIVGVQFPDGDSPPLHTARGDPAVMGDQMVLAVEDFVAAQAALGPLLIVLEDLHWGDLPSVRFIDAALRAAADRALMVLALARPEVDALFPALWARRGVHRIALRELPRRASERLVRQALGEQADDAVVAHLVERAAGNPFYLEEFIRAEREGRDTAAATLPDGGGAPAMATSAASLPQTVLALVQARLDALGDDERLVLRHASAFGRTFRRDGVRALLGEGADDAAIDAVLARLVEREVLAQQPGGGGEGASYAFRHALVREAAYATLTEADRAAAHRAAGEWLERNGDRDALALAAHFDLGRAPARAAACYRRAAEHALEANDFTAALAHAERAIARLQQAADEALAVGAQDATLVDLPSARAVNAGELGALRLLQAVAHEFEGTVSAQRDRAHEAMALLPAGSVPWNTALRVLASGSARLSDAARIEALAEQLLALPAAVQATDEHLSTALHTASWLYRLGREQLADSLVAPVADLDVTAAGGRDPMLIARVLMVRASRARQGGDAGGFLALTEACVQWYERAGNLRVATIHRGSVGYGHFLLGNYAEAERVLRAVVATGERMRLTAAVLLARHNLGIALARGGALDEGLAVETQVVEEFRGRGDRFMEGNSRVYLAQIHALRGEPAAAEREARAGLAMAGDTAPSRAFALGVLAQVLLAQSRAAEALAAAREAVELLALPTGIEEGEELVRLVYAQALRACGERDAARAALAAARERLLARAAAISDPVLRQRFLANVHDNAHTLALAAQWEAEAR